MLHKESKYREKLMKEFHETPIGGHSGVLRTYQRLKLNVVGRQRSGISKDLLWNVMYVKGKNMKLRPP